MGLTLAEIVAALGAVGPALQAGADSLISGLEAVSPDAMKAAEESVRTQLDAEIAKITVTVADLQGALTTAGTTILAGKGPTAGGPDATLS